MGLATLTVLDQGREIDLQVTWRVGYDTDASIGVPAYLQQLWATGARIIAAGDHEMGRLKPYPNMPYAVKVSRLRSSATGFYAIASFLFDRAWWKVSPPYPEVEPVPVGAIP